MRSTVAVNGATGRLGSRICTVVERTDGLLLGTRLSSRSSLEEAGDADLLVDATRIEASERAVEFAIARRIPIVVATSGWDAERIARLRDRVAADAPAVLIVPNFSVASVVSTRLAEIAARFFTSVEVIEAHHAGKVDSPSGTAVRTAEAIATAHPGAFAAPNAQQRARGENINGVPVHSLRLRGVVADQQVVFGGTGETLTLRHETFSSDAYDAGIALALRAAPELRGVVVGLAEPLGLGPLGDLGGAADAGGPRQ